MLEGAEGAVESTTGSDDDGGSPNGTSEPTAQETIETEPTDEEIEAWLKKNGKRIKRKIKAGDNEKEVDLETAFRDAQKVHGADHKFQQASTLRKASEDFINSLKGGDFNRLVKAIGKKEATKLAQDLLIQEMERKEWTEEQWEAHNNKEELSQLKSEREERERVDKERIQAEINQRAMQEIDTEITELIQGMDKKPTPRLIARVAEQMLAHLQQKSGGKLTGKDAWGKVEKDLGQEIVDYFGTMPAEKVLKLLPKPLRKALREAEIAEHVGEDPYNRKKLGRKDGDPPIGTRRPKRKRGTTDDVFREMEQKYSGL